MGRTDGRTPDRYIDVTFMYSAGSVNNAANDAKYHWRRLVQ